MFLKGDILVFKNGDENKKRRLMIALENETVNSTKLLVRELNDWIDRERTVYIYEVRTVGRKGENDTERGLLERYLSKDQWEFTPYFYRINNTTFNNRTNNRTVKMSETTRSPYKKRKIIIVNVQSKEIKEFDSINGAASMLGRNFSAIQKAALYNGVVNGWRVYEEPNTIKKHIKELEQQLEQLELLGIK